MNKYDESCFDVMSCSVQDLGAAVDDARARGDRSREAFLNGVAMARCTIKGLEKQIARMPPTPARALAEGFLHARIVMAAAGRGLPHDMQHIKESTKH